MELWTFEHFLAIVPAFVICLIVSLVLRKFLINKPRHIRMIPFQIATVILLIAEVIKQIVSFGYNGEFYRLYSLPFHVCSLFLFLLPLMAFYKGKGSDLINTLACTICGALTIFMVVIPTMLYPAHEVTGWYTDYLYFHTVFFHNWVLFIFMLILTLNLHERIKKHYVVEILLFGLGYSVVAVTFSYLLQTNFSNFYSCNLGPVKDLVDSISASAGETFGTIFYVSVLMCLHVGFFIGSYYVYSVISNFIKKLEVKSVKKAITEE